MNEKRKLHLQFICVQEHNWKRSLMHTFAAVTVSLLVCTVLLFRSNRARRQKRRGEHLLITYYRRPGRIAFQTSSVVFSWLGIQVCNSSCRLFLVQFFPLAVNASCRFAFSVTGFFGSRWGSIGAISGGGSNFSCLFYRNAALIRILLLCSGRRLGLGSLCGRGFRIFRSGGFRPLQIVDRSVEEERHKRKKQVNPFPPPPKNIIIK